MSAGKGSWDCQQWEGKSRNHIIFEYGERRHPEAIDSAHVRVDRRLAVTTLELRLLQASEAARAGRDRVPFAPVDFRRSRSGIGRAQIE
jgi:hypothetical protein